MRIKIIMDSKLYQNLCRVYFNWITLMDRLYLDWKVRIISNIFSLTTIDEFMFTNMLGKMMSILRLGMVR